VEKAHPQRQTQFSRDDGTAPLMRLGCQSGLQCPVTRTGGGKVPNVLANNRVSVSPVERTTVAMNRPHVTHLDTAFLQLAFAIKLWHYVECYKIDKDAFDISLTAKQDEADTDQVCLPQNQFNTYEDLRTAASNNILICFGATAITLWEAINEKGGINTRKLNPSSNYNECLASLAYMIRCCFAHGTAVPKWKMEDKYRFIYKIGNKTIDLRYMNGKVFDFGQICGYETLSIIRSEAEANDMLL
jgi:hypothetical protein